MKKTNGKLVILLVVVLFIVGIVLVLSGVLSGNSYTAWQKQFNQIEMPANSSVLLTQFSDQYVNTGSNDSKFYGYCVLLQTDSSEQELYEYFLPFVTQMNESAVGNENELNISKLQANQDNRAYHFDDLEQYISNGVEDDSDLYVVFIVKPGRTAFIN
jgi:hypothetical protein